MLFSNGQEPDHHPLHTCTTIGYLCFLRLLHTTEVSTENRVCWTGSLPQFKTGSIQVSE